MTSGETRIPVFILFAQFISGRRKHVAIQYKQEFIMCKGGESIQCAIYPVQ